MEDFIKDLYKAPFIAEGLKEFVYLTNSGFHRDARSLYNSTAAMLEKLLPAIATSDTPLAKQIQDSAIKVKESFDDASAATGIVEGQLIPLLCEYVKNIAGISVDAGKYRILSSDTGFLTIYDTDIARHIHSTYDPMWQAFQIANASYESHMNVVRVFGAGLGYIPYQIWHRSEGAVKIILYEDDSLMLELASLYGVLSLIPETDIDIICDPNKESLASRFKHDIDRSDPSDGLFFSPWKKESFTGVLSNEINRIVINQELSSEMRNRSITNLHRNSRVPHIGFETLRSHLSCDEWIVVSAGPSFDDCLPFLKNKENKHIIAVNTVLRRLQNEGITPDVVVAADQYVQMADHIEGLEGFVANTPLIADWLTNWKYIEKYTGEICFIKTGANAYLTESIHSNDPVWDISGTVSCLAIEAAVNLCASKIYLVGQDLSYPNGQRYAKGMPHSETPDAKWNIQVPSVDGSMVDTCEAFYWFIKSLENQIRKHNDIVFINMSKHGAKIAGTIDSAQ